MSEQMKLCMCGLPAQSYTTESANGIIRYAIGCNDPLCHWTAGEYDTEAAAIAAWNKRAKSGLEELTSHQVDDIIRLQAEVTRLQEILGGWQVENYGDY